MVPVPTDIDLEVVATEVSYVGSPEHKDMPTFAGPPAPRSDATLCPTELNEQQDLLTDWLRTAIAAGQVGDPWEGRYPRYAWHENRDGDWYEARLTNRGLGQYKGYPIASFEKPDL